MRKENVEPKNISTPTITIDMLEKVIKDREQYHIHPGDLLSIDLLRVLAKAPDRMIATIIAPVDTLHKEKYNFTVEFTCESCGVDATITECTLTIVRHFITQLRKKAPILCKECSEKDNLSKLIERNTAEYIKNYLNENDTFDPRRNPGEVWRQINVGSKKADSPNDPVDLNVISTYIRDMPYECFLRTPYWWTVSNRVRWLHKFACEKCGSTKNIMAHHKTYEHHGLEHLYWVTDFMCVCRSCHSKIHGFKNKKGPSPRRPAPYWN
jgi:transcription elongation factor Elf1